jgi:uncharacterized membrane protein
MNKNQNLYNLFLALSIFFFLCIPYLSHSQQNDEDIFLQPTERSISESLFQADSLFYNNKYSEAYLIYKSIFEKEKASPRMLLKMAFIQEGFGDFGSALYYLNLYYLKTSNKKVLAKMEELAAKFQLKGYEYSDADYFLAYIYKYQVYITFAVLGLVLMIFALIYYQKKINRKRPVLAGLFLVVILAVLFIQVNYGKVYQKGIILSSNAYLMGAPSSGADLLEVVQQGHRVEILGQEDVWVKINWNGNPAYIRENNIIKVNL